MDIILFLKKVMFKFKLGNTILQAKHVKGGLTHKMYKLFTDQGKYVIKILNPNIMQKDNTLNNFRKAEELEEILKLNNIKAVYSKKFNQQKMQQLDGQYFYIYDWYDGKTLKDSEIEEKHCQIIGQTLADIHNINLINNTTIANFQNIDWNYYCKLAKVKSSPLYEILNDKLNLLINFMQLGNNARSKLPKVQTICHNDMDSKNVLWIKNDYRLIDLECLTYKNPYLELLEVALYWSGFMSCNININLFTILFKTYFANTKLVKNINWEDIYFANSGLLDWLEFNLKRALLTENVSKEEQFLGINEVKRTLDQIVYYLEIKERILRNVNKFNL